MKSKLLTKVMACTIVGSMIFAGCGATDTAEETATTSVDVNETYSNDEDGGHAIEVSGEEQTYSNIKVTKTGEADGDEADFYGENSAIFATDGATLTLSDIVVETNGTHANAVFSYGEGTTVNISDSTITTSGNCSGGLMTTGGGTMNASNLVISTSGNSSAAIRSDRGGGTVNVEGGTYSTSGTGSPAIYSTADITVSEASLTSTASQGVVVEGNNSVTLNNVTLDANNNTKNSDKSDYYQAVMIYQSMSGDADEGEASFTMTDGSLTNANEDIFFITNTVATINLENVDITNNGDGVFLRAAAAGWGNEGSNGGQANLYANNQTIKGDMIVDEVSKLNLYLQSGSNYTGAINTDGEAGEVYVDLSDGAKWTLTGDSYITSLTCESDSIDLNGYTLYVNGTAYTEGTATTGTALTLESTGGSGDGNKPDGAPGEMPSGEKPDGDAPSGEAPSGDAPSDEKPSGDAPSGKPGDGNEPPSGEKPEDKN